MLSFLFEWSLLRLLTKLTGHFSSRLELASLSAVAGEHIGSDFEAENFLSAPYRSYFFKAVKSRTILQFTDVIYGSDNTRTFSLNGPVTFALFTHLFWNV